ncbi:hypothetical protein BGX21_002380 [Mortierella sp. AD011]|nr:hypothetical protein BGX20_011392 [Mortierella sp. AD010]KAF9380378.1 hypothetical protein BGX21_002380 [Mortierella sp. AD011]
MATSTGKAATTTAATTTTPVYNLPTGQSNAGSGSTIFNLPTGTATFAYPALTSSVSGANTPNYNQGSGTSSSNKNNLPMIVGVTVAGIVVVALAGLLVQRLRVRSRTNAINQARNRNNPTPGGTLADDERGDRAKLAKSFTIRAPPSVYVEDDQDLDQTGHPRYKSATDASNHPYYGDRSPGIVEYELSDTSGQKYGPASIAERKRYVEQQQRKVMDEYEMFNPHKDVPPPSPYPPSQITSAPSYTSGPRSPTMTPSMGGRSPRVQHPGQPISPFVMQDSDYKY